MFYASTHTLVNLSIYLDPRACILLKMADTGAVPVADAKEFEFFYEILNAFRDAAASAEDGDFTTMKTDLFLNAMTMFLRIFDAFANPFFAEVVKKDVQGNITVSCVSIYIHIQY